VVFRGDVADGTSPVVLRQQGQGARQLLPRSLTRGSNGC
jgi:hypothetical protein